MKGIRMKLEEKGALTTKEASIYCSISVTTLIRLRAAGKGAAYKKEGRKILYPKKELEKWLNSKLIKTVY